MKMMMITMTMMMMMTTTTMSIESTIITSVQKYYSPTTILFINYIIL